MNCYFAWFPEVSWMPAAWAGSGANTTSSPLLSCHKVSLRSAGDLGMIKIVDSLKRYSVLTGKHIAILCNLGLK
jgi:hypothetical protein